MTGVYKILHLPTNSVYIGQTSRPFQTRWNEHKNQLNDGSHKNWKLRELWNISDELDFEFQEISRVPDIFTPLNAQIFRALEEIYSIKEHKANGFSVLNITDGETVSTKKAWAELIENYKSIESNRIRKLKKRHSDRTSRRRNLEELKVELQKLRWHIYHQYEFKIDKIQHVLNRKSIFYRLLGLVPSNKRQQTLNKEIEGLREKIRIRNDSHASLKDALAEHGYILNSSPTHWEVFDLYRKVKKNAYSLRNHHAELKERDLPSNEIPLDLNCPTTSEISEAFEYLESFF
jgi:predicted nuclease with TOPRIM domain